MQNLESGAVLQKLIDMDKKLQKGVSLTFAVDNMVGSMEQEEKEQFVKIIYSLISKDYLARHTDKMTDNGIPFWLELTDRGRRQGKK